MSIASIRNPWTRRTLLVTAGPFLFFGIILCGAGSGAARAFGEAVSAFENAWIGRK